MIGSVGKIRNVLKGYNKTGINHGFFKIRKLFDELAAEDISKHLDSHLIRTITKNNNKILSQYLTERLCNAKFRYEVYRAIGSNGQICYPMPLEWQQVLIRNNFQVNKFFSTILWRWFCIRSLILGFIFYLKVIFLAKIHKSSNNGDAYFHQLKSNNIPSVDYINSKNVITWFLTKYQFDLNVKHDCKFSKECKIENSPIYYKKPQHESINSISQLFAFFFLGGKFIFQCVYIYFRGDYGNLILLKEILKLLLIVHSLEEVDYKYHLFPFSNSIYRPLWSYEAENRGSEIIAYFYSTSEQPSFCKNYEKQAYIYNQLTWPKYFVWDLYHYEKLKSEIPENPIIEVVGYIPFSSNKPYVNKLNKCLAVFDIYPLKLTHYIGMSTYTDYIFYNKKLHINFIKNIYEIANQEKLNILFKMKRSINNNSISKNYIECIKALSRNNNFEIVNPDTNAEDIINTSVATISMPFTSTGVVAKLNGSASIYYDPTGKLNIHDKASHGVLIINNFTDLNKWIKNL